MDVVTRSFEGTNISKRADGYIDATAACKACQKEFGAYRRLESTTKYLTCLASLLKKNVEELICINRGIGACTSWVHPSVALDLARWLSCEFAVWMDSWFLEEMRQNETAIQHNKRLYKNQLEIRTEAQLHESIVVFVRDKFPDALILPSLGETGDTDEKRRANWRKGYRAGSPDLLLLMRHPRYVGLALEFKHPGGLGKTSEKQEAFIKDIKTQGWLTLVSDSYVDIIIAINDYIRDASIVCPQCQKQCPSLSSLGHHVRSTHSEIPPPMSAKRRKRESSSTLVSDYLMDEECTNPQQGSSINDE
jgi:hypothetical protein